MKHVDLGMLQHLISKRLNKYIYRGEIQIISQKKKPMYVMLRNKSNCWKILKTEENPNFQRFLQNHTECTLVLNLPSAAFLTNVCDSSAHTRVEWINDLEFRAMLILAIFRSNIMYFDSIE